MATVRETVEHIIHNAEKATAHGRARQAGEMPKEANTPEERARYAHSMAQKLGPLVLRLAGQIDGLKREVDRLKKSRS
jgi:hypothetical protein